MTETDLHSTTECTSTTDSAAERSVWVRALYKVGLVYLFSRACVVVGAGIVAAELRADQNKIDSDLPTAVFADPQYIDKVIPRHALRPMVDVLTSWDGLWYLRIVRDGYPRFVQPDITYDVPDARAAFFPTYPTLVKAVDFVLPGNETLAALLINFVLGALAVLLTGLIARRLYDTAVATKAMILMAMFPGSFVLSFAYTEALLLALAAGCMWFLLNRQWLAAGILAAFGTATRPNGIALVAACAIASYVAIRRRGEWRSIVAPVLAPVGFVGFQLWLGQHTGEAGVWFRVQTEAWGEGTSFGLTAIRRTARAFYNPLSSPTDMITAMSLVVTVLLCWFAWKRRLPMFMTAYCAVVIALMLLPSTVTARPRFLYTAFPLLIAAAAWLHDSKRDWWPYLIGACSAGLVGLTALYGVFGAIP